MVECEQRKPTQEERLNYIYKDVLRTKAILDGYGWSKRMTKGDGDKISVISHRLTGIGNHVYNEIQGIKRPAQD